MPDASWLPPRPPGEDRPGSLWSGGGPPRGWAAPAPPERDALDTAGRRDEPAPEFVHADGRPKNGAVAAGLVMSATGLGLLGISIGLLFPISIPASMGGWAFAIVARRRLGADRDSRDARKARVALVLGIVGVVLGFVAALIWIGLIASDAGSIRDELSPRDPRERPA